MRGAEVGFFPPLKTSIRTTALLAVESRPLSGAKARAVGSCAAP